MMDNAGLPEWLSMLAGLGVSFAGGYHGNKIFAGKTTAVDGEQILLPQGWSLEWIK